MVVEGNYRKSRTSTAAPRPWRTGATPAQVEELDRLSINRYNHPLEAMLHRAGDGLAKRALLMAEGLPITVLVGPGVNGAGGLAASRRLVELGADVRVVVAAPPRDPATFLQLASYAREGGLTVTAAEIPATSLLVDALLGYRQRGPPRGGVGKALEALKRHGGAWLSLDVATGVHPRTGLVQEPNVPAAHVLALGCLKTGTTMGPHTQASILDIGMPEAAYVAAGLERPPFHLANPLPVNAPSQRRHPGRQ